MKTFSKTITKLTIVTVLFCLFSLNCDGYLPLLSLNRD